LPQIGFENAHGCPKNAENSFGIDFLKCNEYLNDIVQVTGDETGVSFMNVETKGQSKQWIHIHSPNRLKKFKQTTAYQKADGICFLGQEMSADGGIHVTRDHNNIRSVLHVKH
jgi:hypothetical protein